MKFHCSTNVLYTPNPLCETTYLTTFQKLIYIYLIASSVKFNHWQLIQQECAGLRRQRESERVEHGFP